MAVCNVFLMCYFLAIVCLQSFVEFTFCGKITESEIITYREKVTQMFYHGYDNYMQHAYPYDELRPLSCDGVDTWGKFSLTLIDVLDTLAVMGNYSEFRRVAQLLIDSANFDMNINVSVFETNIRVVGGLLSAHLMSYRSGMQTEPGWPCSGPLLRLAEDMARRLLPAFETDTGMPYGTVNLRHGVPQGETAVTCTAGVGTFIVEFGTLSRLLGDPIFETAALKAMDCLWHARSFIGLVGNHIDVMSGKWVALDSGIGAGVDSYYEYLVKGAALLQKPELMSMFNEYRKAITRYMLRDDWYMWVNMQKGQVTLPVFQSLEAYWPGLLTLVGDIDNALKAVHNYHQVWKQFGFTPEFYNIPQAEPNNNREGYPLRPELVESLMYIYKATKDPLILQMGIDILESIQHSARTPCGYATIKDVRTHLIEDRMESFFLAETTKYLYLLFDPDNFLHGNGSIGTVVQTSHGDCIIDAGGYIFNTEAHPIDMAAVYCCGVAKGEYELLQHFHDNMDLMTLLDLKTSDFLKPLHSGQKHQKRSYKETFSHAPEFIEANTLSEVVVLNPSLTNLESGSSIKSLVTDMLHSHLAVEKLSAINEAQQNGTENNPLPLSANETEKVLENTTNKLLIQPTLEQQSPSLELSYHSFASENRSSLSESNAGVSSDADGQNREGDGLSEDVPTETNIFVKAADPLGAAQVKYLGEVNEFEENHAYSLLNEEECVENDVSEDKLTEVNFSSADEKQNQQQRSLWSGTKPIMSSVERDTLYSSGLSRVTGIGLMGLERNSSLLHTRGKLEASYEMLTCPAQPFILRFAVMGEMFGVN